MVHFVLKQDVQTKNTCTTQIKENIKVNITNTKNTDLLTRNSRNLTYSLTKNDLSSKIKQHKRL